MSGILEAHQPSRIPSRAAYDRIGPDADPVLDRVLSVTARDFTGTEHP